MILHCKNAEMTILNIVISSFLQCKIIQFLLFFFILIFFLNLAIFYIGENKKKSKLNFFIFFLKCKNLGRRIRKPSNKKKLPKSSN